jgi:selenide,water dikinase
LSAETDENLIVGIDTHDDAGVYCLSEELALVVTTDLIPPPTDDPERFGRIAAANALSDVYAMGARPVTCLNILCFPTSTLDAEIMAGILHGASEKISEAGAVLAGGHTIEDPEPKFGLAGTGVVNPAQVWRNDTAEVGDALVLTKPIGSGVILNANLKGWVDDHRLHDCLNMLEALNGKAAELAREFPVHAATDVTGFGLGGHALEMARGALVGVQLDFLQVPQFDGALEMYERDVTTRANVANREMAGAELAFSAPRRKAEEELIFDPQTNGGLLFAVPDAVADKLVTRLRDAGIKATSRVGQVVEAGGEPWVEVC